MKRIEGITYVSFIILSCVFCGCSQDDDNYESDMYTLAEMGTRLGDPEPAVNNVVIPETVTSYHTYDITLSYSEGVTTSSYVAEVYVRIYRDKNIPSVDLVNYYCIDPTFTVDEAWMQPRVNAPGYILSFKGKDFSGIENTGVLENHVFF